MVQLTNVSGESIRTFDSVLEYDKNSVTFMNNGYLSMFYADTDAGEYIEDPDVPAPPPDLDLQTAYQAGADAFAKLVSEGQE